MRAAVFHGPGRLELTEVPDPVAGPGDVVLDVTANTVCGTDLRLLRGEKAAKPGTILGHEVCGVVSQVGEGVTGYQVGDRVAVIPSITCGNCFYCNRDLEQYCETYRLIGYEVDGGLADKMLIPAPLVARGNLIKSTVDHKPGVLSLAEPLSCAINGLREYRVDVGDTVVILGAGPIGLLHAQLARICGARQVIVSQTSAPRREQALRFGAAHVVDPNAVAPDGKDLRQRVLDLTEERGADIAVICIGRIPLMQDALTLVRKGGRVNAFAGFPKGATAEIDPNIIHYNQLQVTGGSNSRRSDYAQAVAMLDSGQIDGAAMVTHTFPLEKVTEAIEFVASGEGLKVAVTPSPVA